jgi:phage tail sheath gpL-like
MATSPEQVAAETGDGFILHRLALAAFAGSGGLEFWYIPVETDVGGVQATGTLTITVTTALAGTLYLYVGNDLVQVTVAAGATDAEIATATAAAVNADTTLPVTAAAALGVVTFTAKDSFTWGNEIPLSVNQGFDQSLPGGVSTVFVAMSTGAGASNMDDALAALGTGDARNEKHFTDLIHCWGNDSTALNELSIYNGQGDTFTGLYEKPIARPLRSLIGDNSSTLATLITLADGRRLDRTSDVVGCYGSPEHPQETAAKIVGLAAATNNAVVSEHYLGKVVPGTIPGSTTDTNNWTLDSDNRDTAVKNGISTTYVEDGALKIANLVTFYRPASVPVSSNGYRAYSNISKLQNILNSLKTNFKQPKYQGVYLVENKRNVTNLTAQGVARDIQDIYGDLIVLAQAWAGEGWLFNSEYTVGRLTSEDLVQIRAGGTGFDYTMPVYLSGELGVFNGLVQFDINVSVLV